MQPPPPPPGTGEDRAVANLAERARRLGPLPYSALGMSPPPVDLPAPAEVAAWEARTIDELWNRAGRPDPFTVVEVAAGDGTTAAAMLGAETRPGCTAALRLVLVEADQVMRESHGNRLALESPALLSGPVGPPSDPDEDPAPAEGIGPLVTSLAEIPVVRGWCAVIAVGWLSRFPVDVFEWHAGKWNEVRLAAGDTGELLQTISVELDPDRSARLDGLVGEEERREGARFAGHGGAAAWLRGALTCADSGWVVVADRLVETTAPLPPGEVPVALDQLVAVRTLDTRASDGPGGLASARWRIG